MIENKEINAEYLLLTKSVVFNEKPTSYELSDLMITFEEWKKERLINKMPKKKNIDL